MSEHNGVLPQQNVLTQLGDLKIVGDVRNSETPASKALDQDISAREQNPNLVSKILPLSENELIKLSNTNQKAPTV